MFNFPRVALGDSIEKGSPPHFVVTCRGLEAVQTNPTPPLPAGPRLALTTLDSEVRVVPLSAEKRRVLLAP